MRATFATAVLAIGLTGCGPPSPERAAATAMNSQCERAATASTGGSRPRIYRRFDDSGTSETVANRSGRAGVWWNSYETCMRNAGFDPAYFNP